MKNVTATAHMKGFVNVTSGDIDALKAAVATQGPISVAIDASHRSLSFYANGVYYEPDCGKGVNTSLHCLTSGLFRTAFSDLEPVPYYVFCFCFRVFFYSFFCFWSHMLDEADHTRLFSPR